MSTSAIAIGRRIKRAREDGGLTQEGVVFTLRERDYTTSVSTYQRWEKTGLIQSHELVELADVFRVPQQWLAEGGDLERARVHKLVDEMREDGFSEGEIFDTLVGLRNARRAASAELPAEPTAEASAQPGDEVPSDEEIAEQMAHRPDGPARIRGGSRRDRRGTKRRPSADGGEQS